MDGGYCRCYEAGNIGCVGEPVFAPERRLLLLDDIVALMLHYFQSKNVVFYGIIQSMSLAWNFNN